MKLSSQELIIYLAVWGMLYASPLLSFYIQSISNQEEQFYWSEVFIVWSKISVYLLLFLVHNFILAPLLINKHKRLLFFSLTACIVAVFTVYQCKTRPNPPMFKHKMERKANIKPHLMPDDGFKPMKHDRHPHEKRFKHGRPPGMIAEHDIVAVILLILMFGMNLGIKYYVHTREDQKKMMRLEKENLMQQLEYLKYQLNPHFLMNTLNNIHALIDIDSEKAQEAVIQLSKILRYVLYDSNKSQVLMSQESEFMQSYIQLMRMRYTDKLHLSVNENYSGSSMMVAPLLFISFVENAFKHGVSYQDESFIEIESKNYSENNKERLLWICRNSKHSNKQSSNMPRQGGVGMTNIRQRLNLIYGNDYKLNINETDKTYEVMLDIPLNKHSTLS